MNHLIVCDIDGTLINAKGAGHRAMSSAFEASYGVANAFAGLSFAGATDLEMLNQATQKHQISTNRDTLEAFKTRFASHLQKELQRDPGDALPGLPDRLFELQAEGFYLALATGNFKISAYLKLAPFGMAGFFPVGGFGDDGTTRLAVLSRAIERAQGHYQKQWDRVTVLGDTPGDMDAAQKLAAFGLGVTTGPYTEAELRQAGAQAVIENLGDMGILMAHLRP